MGKKNILLNWESSRSDLMEPFVALKDDFNFSVIWYKSPPGHPKRHPFEEYYFGDFHTPYEILKKVKPDIIVFFGVHSFPQISLNTAAKNKGIITYAMHHGVFSSNLTSITQMRRDMGIVKQRRVISSLSSLFFYFSALRFSNRRDFGRYFKFPFLLHKYGSLAALKKCVFSSRLPDKYIQLSPHNALFQKEMDHLDNDDKFIYIGHPHFDKFFSDLALVEKAGIKNEGYWLLVDFPNIESNIGFKKIGAEAKTDFYRRLSRYAKNDGCRLKIKLHPAGYDSTFNYEDDNIELLKDIDIVKEIVQSKRCFSFYSTLLIPIIFIKQHCIVFDLGLDIGLQRELIELGVVISLSLNSFNEEEVTKVYDVRRDVDAYNEFVRRYLYFTDGRSTERLKNILIGDEAA